MWRGVGGAPDGLPMAEMGESNHHDHGRKDSACDNDLWPRECRPAHANWKLTYLETDGIRTRSPIMLAADPDLMPLPPPPRPFVRMGSTMTGSEASLPGPRRKEQRRQEWLNSEILNAVLSGSEVDKKVAQ